VTFQRDALFDEANFWREAEFFEATFQGVAEFSKVTVRGEARFRRAVFWGEARFREAAFWREGRFDDAAFERARQIGPMMARQLVFDDAVFSERLKIDVAAAALCGRRARFPAGVQFRLRWASVILDDADLAAPAILGAAPDPFPGLDEDMVAVGWRRLPPGPQEQRWRPRLLSLRRADVAGLRIANVDLRACRFSGTHNLHKLRIEGEPLFARTHGWWRARRKTLAQEQQWRASRPGRWRPGGWYPRACQPPASPKLEPPPALAPVQLAALYQELRRGLEDSKNEPGAADFYYGEMEMRRLDRRTPWAERVILWLYWLLAGYGLRGLRALASLAVVVVGLAALLHVFGYAARPSPPSFWGSLLYAASSTLSIGDEQVRLTGWGKLLRITLRLAGPVLLGLMLLSVRNRVKR
jgi:Pentapeptide repeats (9 copies)